MITCNVYNVYNFIYISQTAEHKRQVNCCDNVSDEQPT